MQQDQGLRRKQTQLTRDLVLEALAEIIVEQGLADFSVQEVADRAGVSHRTVYRHFETRGAMLDALVRWLEEQVATLGGMALPTDAAEVVPLLRAKFVAIDKVAPAAIAVLRLESGRRAHSKQSFRSAQAMREALAGTTAHLSPTLAEDTIALIRQIGSSRLWLALREEAGMDGARSSEVAAWAVGTLIEELKAGRGPGIHRS